MELSVGDLHRASGGCFVGLYCQVYPTATGSTTARFDDGFLTGFAGFGTHYYHGDHLGSARLMTDSLGNSAWSATYLPFGTEWNAQPTSNHYKFTGKERDAESNLDYFGARHYASAMGRFMSADRNNAILTRQNLEAGGLPSAAATGYLDGYLENPQNWNQYAYVRNNPIRFVDTTGAAPVDGHHLIISRNILTSPLREILRIKSRLALYPVMAGPTSRASIRCIASTVRRLSRRSRRQSRQPGTETPGASLNGGPSHRDPKLNGARDPNFLDELEANNPGARAALAAAITGYRVSTLLAARILAAGLALEIMRMPQVFFIDVQKLMNQGTRTQASDPEANRPPPHSRCLMTRAGQCVD